MIDAQSTSQLTPEARAAAERIRRTIDEELGRLPRFSKLWRAAHGALCVAERELDVKHAEVQHEPA